jgi:hypothetical protein
MPYSTLTDLVLPESFSADVLNRATTNSRFFASGAIADVSAEIDVMPSKGTVLMPFWNDLDGASQPTHNGVNLVVNSVTQGQDKAAVLARGKAFGSEDLAAAFKGEDPISFIEARFGDYWAREYDRIAVQNALTAMATVVSGASMAANVFDISGLSGAASVVSSSSMIDAPGVLGDNEEDFTAIAMHSNFKRKLDKLDLLDNSEKDSEGRPISSYRGRPVVSTDRLAPSSGVYPVVFFGQGAIGYSRGTPKRPSEIGRDPFTNGGQEAVITRAIFAIHPRGIAFTGSIVGQTAIDSELATANKWSRAWSAKNIRLGLLKARI